MDLVRVFDKYPEPCCLDSCVLTLTRTRSDVTFYVNPNPNIGNAYNAEREAQHILKAAQLLNRRRLPQLTLSQDVLDIFAQDLNPSSYTYQEWKSEHIFTVRLLQQ